MKTAKVFENGRSQAVRLPKEYRFSCDEVRCSKIGDVVMLIPEGGEWEAFMTGLDMFTDDFMSDGRAEEKLQERDLL